jgi:hypothetical protein
MTLQARDFYVTSVCGFLKGHMEGQVCEGVDCEWESRLKGSVIDQTPYLSSLRLTLVDLFCLVLIVLRFPFWAPISAASLFSL